jgi:hypothetical protein
MGQRQGVASHSSVIISEIVAQGGRPDRVRVTFDERLQRGHSGLGAQFPENIDRSPEISRLPRIRFRVADEYQGINEDRRLHDPGGDREPGQFGIKRDAGLETGRRAGARRRVGERWIPFVSWSERLLARGVPVG